MYASLLYLFIVLSIIILLLILFQPSNQQDIMSLLHSDKGDELFANQKVRGLRHVLVYMTMLSSIVWIILAVFLMYLSER